jgi:hypothetical protein
VTTFGPSSPVPQISGGHVQIRRLGRVYVFAFSEYSRVMFVTSTSAGFGPDVEKWH